jgi:hypothetical protein
MSATVTGPMPGAVSAAEHAVMQTAAARFLECRAGHDAGLAAAIAGGLQELTLAGAALTAPCAAPRDDYHRIPGRGHVFY